MTAADGAATLSGLASISTVLAIISVFCGVIIFSYAAILALLRAGRRSIIARGWVPPPGAASEHNDADVPDKPDPAAPDLRKKPARFPPAQSRVNPFPRQRSRMDANAADRLSGESGDELGGKQRRERLSNLLNDLRALIEENYEPPA